ncbi:ion transporter [Rhodobacteraceae bacterium RKSG542]|uniref:potassium channel family protein n=1 Tax=Pseudovibrio flavus TaxID=2529854 RepID=UPI0012BC1CC6|nr:ion channel [Pseudovibrio flavus]MTI17691.1 ion transporter [Pseudovibrio flavus]
MKEFRNGIKRLYFGPSTPARVFRFALLGFDLVTISYFIISATVWTDIHHFWLDYSIGAVLTLDYIARLYISPRPLRAMTDATAIADLIVIFSLFAATFLDNLGFLRVVRMLRLLRSYHVLKELRGMSSWFRRNEEIIQSATNLLVFIFLITAVVFVLEEDINPKINSYMDALYFTVTTLTTTGFGDIIMTDTVGRFITILIMIFGVALFLRLIQTIFRPTKVKYTCPDCGLNRHDLDAVHCKHCGRTIHIPTEGEWQ